MKPISLFGKGTKSFSLSVTAQRRLNCFYDIRLDGDRANIITRGTPGQSVFTTLSDSPIRGWRVIGVYMYIVAGSTVFTVDTGGNINNLGAINNTGQLVTITDDSITMTIVDGVQGYAVLLPLGAPALITDPSFPNGASSICTLDSHTVANVPNSRLFSKSNLLNAAIWTPGVQGAKENTSDYLSATFTLNGMLVLAGLKSMEFWQDVGTSPNPFQRINGASQTWGLAARYSWAELNNTAVFLGQNPQGGVQVLKLDGYTPRRISDSDIENIFSRFPTFSDAIALTYMIDGHPMYQLTFPSANRSFLYDDSTGFWYEVQTGVATTGRHSANLGIVFNSRNYVCDNASGIIYQLDPNVFTDNGVPIKRQIASRHIRMDGNEFSLSEIVLEMEVGVGLDNGQGSDPQIMMQSSQNAGRTFGPEKWRSIGRKGAYKTEVSWNRLGSSDDFVFLFTMTDPVKFVITQAQAVFMSSAESSQ